ncbi:hypothetical protein pdam_00023823 [Pocillopora damicornis]|uniref:Uncharacterized protein n=1 Tax=Pocillopora damicornis TaxID=46731 RepID=A0A3M6V4H9_POCDA|nr:hypothetical protein pdam_00023823 [Pocillopora damicornis]
MEFTSSLAFPGKRLINHLIRTVESPVQGFCSALCYMEPNCVSYNELVASGSPRHCFVGTFSFITIGRFGLLSLQLGAGDRPKTCGIRVG